MLPSYALLSKCHNTLTLTHKTDITLTYIHPSTSIPCSCIQTLAPTADQNQHKSPEIQSLQSSDCIQSNDMHVDWAQTTEYLWQSIPSEMSHINTFCHFEMLYDSREHKRIFKIMQKLSKLVNWSGYLNSQPPQHHILRNWQNSFHYAVLSNKQVHV